MQRTPIRDRTSGVLFIILGLMTTSRNLKWSLIFVSVFPLLPNITELSQHRWLVILSQILGVLVFQNCCAQKLKSWSLILIIFWLALLTQTLVTVASIFSMSPPKFSIFLAWISLLSSIFIPIYEKISLDSRILAIFSSVFVGYSLLSTCYEPLFLLVLLISLYLWLQNEKRWHQIYFSSHSKLSTEDIFLTLKFLLFILLAFFGCGNIASLNSFSPSSILPFVHIYSPHIMAVLLFLKVILPFIPVCVAFLVIIRKKFIIYELYVVFLINARIILEFRSQMV